jgi:hypothetical protein
MDMVLSVLERSIWYMFGLLCVTLINNHGVVEADWNAL